MSHPIGEGKMRIAALGVGGAIMGTQHRSINSTFGKICQHVDGMPTSDRGVAKLGGRGLKPVNLGAEVWWAGPVELRWGGGTISPPESGVFAHMSAISPATRASRGFAAYMCECM